MKTGDRAGFQNRQVYIVGKLLEQELSIGLSYKNSEENMRDHVFLAVWSIWKVRRQATLPGGYLEGFLSFADLMMVRPEFQLCFIVCMQSAD